MSHNPRALLQAVQKRWARAGSVSLLPWVVLIIGLSGTAAVCEQTRRFGMEEHRRIENTLRDSVVDAIRSKLETDIAILSGVAGFFNGSSSVDRHAFKTYFNSIAVNTGQLRGVQGVGFARWVLADEKPSYEAQVGREGFAGFHIRPTSRRSQYSSIEFLEPFDWRNQRAFGYDMYSEPVRRQAMERARKTGTASLSGKVRLVQETEADLQRGVLIYVPIFSDHGEVTASADRRLVGWAYSPLRMNDVVNNAIATIDNPDMAGTSVLVFDGEQPIASQLLYDGQKLVNRNKLQDPAYEPIEIGGRSWLVGVQLSPSLISPNGISSQFWINLMLGCSVSVIASLMTRILVSNHLATKHALAISEAAVQERAIASTVFEESGQGILVSNPEGMILMANSAFCQLTGYRISEIKGQKTNLLKSGKQNQEFYANVWHKLKQKGYWEGDLWNRIRSGELRCHHLSISTVRDAKLAPIFYVGMYQDVTERHQQEQAARFMAQHDSLTGLANRSMLMEQLDCYLLLAKRHRHALALLYIDLDGFKPVNDHFGHNLGDRVLKVVADRFAKVTRECDLLCRLGGDEFVVLVREAGTIEELKIMASRLVEASEVPFADFDHAITISASVGIARYPDHGSTAELLLAAADNAMYRAKRSDQVHVDVSSQA